MVQWGGGSRFRKNCKVFFSEGARKNLTGGARADATGKTYTEKKKPRGTRVKEKCGTKKLGSSPG